MVDDVPKMKCSDCGFVVQAHRDDSDTMWIYKCRVCNEIIRKERMKDGMTIEDKKYEDMFRTLNG